MTSSTARKSLAAATIKELIQAWLARIALRKEIRKQAEAASLIH